ncbi:MAG: hypothetical protein KC910_21575 [Candidatus Eremiobacteraeota bacterium]|nr:hypothetical protein [Candidatus Eremiobacteraeota bacterium]
MLVAQLVPGCQARQLKARTIVVSGTASHLVEAEQLLSELDRDTPELCGALLRLTSNGSKQIGIPLTAVKPGRVQPLSVYCVYDSDEFVLAEGQFLAAQGEATILKQEQGRQLHFIYEGKALTIGFGWAIWGQDESAEVSRWEPNEQVGFYSLVDGPDTCCAFALTSARKKGDR